MGFFSKQSDEDKKLEKWVEIVDFIVEEMNDDRLSFFNAIVQVFEKTKSEEIEFNNIVITNKLEKDADWAITAFQLYHNLSFIVQMNYVVPSDFDTFSRLLSIKTCGDAYDDIMVYLQRYSEEGLESKEQQLEFSKDLTDYIIGSSEDIADLVVVIQLLKFLLTPGYAFIAEVFGDVETRKKIFNKGQI